MTEKTLIQQYVQIAVVVTAYWFISITLGNFTYSLEQHPSDFFIAYEKAYEQILHVSSD